MSSSPIFEHAIDNDVGECHFFYDKSSQLGAIIAIHSTQAGPALGGCRFRPYVSWDAATLDAQRLAKGMTYKSILAGLPLGGGKAVIRMPDKPFSRRALFSAFGRVLDHLNGRYITAVDMGTTVSDMDMIAEQTAYVTCTSKTEYGPANPSQMTALGVFRGIQSAAAWRYQSSSLKGCRVLVQGVGAVGAHLVHLLVEAGASVSICDEYAPALEAVVSKYPVTVIEPAACLSTPCDILAPCATGGLLTPAVVSQLSVDIIAGAANNQLSSPEVAQQLAERDILYAPDYVVNAGGVIQVASSLATHSDEQALKNVENIAQTCHEIFKRSQQRGQNTLMVANDWAEEKLHALQSSSTHTALEPA